MNQQFLYLIASYELLRTLNYIGRQLGFLSEITILLKTGKLFMQILQFLVVTTMKNFTHQNTCVKVPALGPQIVSMATSVLYMI